MMDHADGAAGPVRFFQCCEHDCGLRFPVTLADDFRGGCPRCRGRVALAAQRDTGGDLSSAGTGVPRTPLHLLLDNWRSSFNVGSALRSADGVGAVMVHLCGITPTPTQAKVAKTALGAETRVAWRYHPNAVEAAQALRAGGARLWVLETLPTATPLHALELPSGSSTVVLAAGNEIAGVDPGLVALADQVVMLPMAGGKRSLNVAIALSIAAYWCSFARTVSASGQQSLTASIQHNAWEG